MKEVKAFQCSSCSFYRKTKKSVQDHETRCFKNPKNRACASCKFNVTSLVTVYDRDHGGDPGSTDYEVPIHWCEKYDLELKKGTLKRDCYHHIPKV